MNTNPKYDNDLVTLGDLKKYLNESGEETQELIKDLPKSYSSPPVPPYSVGAILYYNHYVYRCVTERKQGAFNINDWEIVATDDNALDSWIDNTYTVDKANIQEQIDNKIETYYQSSDPNTWTTDIEKESHVGDFWYNTSNDTQWRYCKYNTNPVTYGWAQVDIPQAVYNTINTKKSIYTSKPTSYKENDMWIIEDDITDSDLPEGTEDNPIVAGDWVFATQDSNSYNKAHWVKMDTYSVDINAVAEQAASDNDITNQRFSNYVTNDTYGQAITRITTIEEDTYKKWEINQKLTDGSVTKVNTQSVILDINGMTYERAGEPTKTTVNNIGIRTSTADLADKTVLFAGYVEPTNTEFEDYKGQTLVASQNIMIKKWFEMPDAHSRIESYENGGGMFYV